MSKTDNDQPEDQRDSAGKLPLDVSESRRRAVAKLVYASPVMASIVFSQKGAAQFSPPPPPGG